MILWLAGTIAVACLAVLAGRWRPWAAGTVLTLAGVLAVLLEWRRRAARVRNSKIRYPAN